MITSEPAAVNIAMIGAGRVAYHLTHALQSINPIKTIYSRTYATAYALAQQLNANAVDHLDALLNHEVIFICVNDAQIAEVAAQLAHLNYQGLVVHTSGATPLTVISHYGLRAAVFYPLQSFSFNQQIDWQHTPILLEATSTDDMQYLKSWALQLSNQVYQYSSEQRATLHLAAVFACNFSNYCIDVAQQLLNAQHMDTQLLQPLILNTVQKLNVQSAFLNQTGPAARHDVNTLNRHEAQLSSHDDFLKLYQLLSQQIAKRHS